MTENVTVSAKKPTMAPPRRIFDVGRRLSGKSGGNDILESEKGRYTVFPVAAMPMERVVGEYF